MPAKCRYNSQTSFRFCKYGQSLSYEEKVCFRTADSDSFAFWWQIKAYILVTKDAQQKSV